MLLLCSVGIGHSPNAVPLLHNTNFAAWAPDRRDLFGSHSTATCQIPKITFPIEITVCRQDNDRHCAGNRANNGTVDCCVLQTKARALETLECAGREPERAEASCLRCHSPQVQIQISAAKARSRRVANTIPHNWLLFAFVDTHCPPTVRRPDAIVPPINWPIETFNCCGAARADSGALISKTTRLELDYCTGFAISRKS